MPPIRKKDPLQSARMEDKIELAILGLQNKRFRSVREASRFLVPRTTLQNPMSGVQYRQIKRAYHRDSTRPEECRHLNQNLRRLVRESTAIKRQINERTGSPTQVMDQAMIQMIEVFETATKTVLLLRKENKDLRAALAKELRRYQKPKRREAQAVTTGPGEPEPSASQAVVRRQFRCSGCGIEGHKISRCPNRTSK